MTDTQLAQMALSAIVRCKEQIDLFALVNILCGKKTHIIESNGFDKIKTFGAGKSYGSREWNYFLIQMLIKNIIIIDYSNI